MSDVNYIGEVRPNPGNEQDAQCSICGAVLVCLSCGYHRDASVRVLEEALEKIACVGFSSNPVDYMKTPEIARRALGK